YDPSGPDPSDVRLAGIEIVTDPYAATEGAEVLAVLTEWDEFKWLDFDKVAELMAGRRVVDARNLIDRTTLLRRGFEHAGIGRPWPESSSPVVPDSSDLISVNDYSTGVMTVSASTI